MWMPAPVRHPSSVSPLRANGGTNLRKREVLRLLRILVLLQFCALVIFFVSWQFSRAHHQPPALHTQSDGAHSLAVCHISQVQVSFIRLRRTRFYTLLISAHIIRDERQLSAVAGLPCVAERRVGGCCCRAVWTWRTLFHCRYVHACSALRKSAESFCAECRSQCLETEKLSRLVPCANHFVAVSAWQYLPATVW